MVDFKADERLNTLNHSCAHVMAQAVKHLYPNAKFWVGPVVKEGFYYDIDLGDVAVNDEIIAAIEKEMKKVCKEGKKIFRRGWQYHCLRSGRFHRPLPWTSRRQH